uniref:Uncharacterized protein n=1 Tax=Cucumis melo TaxID=3656 RepID=A0A9I9DWY9_CUCME
MEMEEANEDGGSKYAAVCGSVSREGGGWSQILVASGVATRLELASRHQQESDLVELATGVSTGSERLRQRLRCGDGGMSD